LKSDNLTYLLQKYWGYSSFRTNQREAIESVLSGRDTVVLFPTGGGKSLVYQVAGLAKEGCCLIITPLISLIQDQIKELTQKRIIGDYISSQKSKSDVVRIFDNIKFGHTKFLFVSPERFKSELFISKIKEVNISFVAIDEAHCISSWGHDFRPAYLELGKIKSLLGDIAVLALTATATPKVVSDLITVLNLTNPSTFRDSFKRENIEVIVNKTNDKNQSILNEIKKVNSSTILYARTRKDTERLSFFLTSNGVDNKFYHAGLDHREREKIQKNWFRNSPPIIVATTAFGMGINKSDVRLVLHDSIPPSIEDYYQEIGRAGRDGELSKAILFYNDNDLTQLKTRLEKAYPAIETVKSVYNKIYRFFDLAYNHGEGQLRFFKMNDFFNFCNEPAFVVYHSMKILERNHWFQLDSEQKQKASIKIPVQRRDLLNLNKEPDLEELLQHLLRNYDGLFFSFIKINIDDIAKSLSLTEKEVHHKLIRLSKFKMLIYNHEKIGDRVYFLKNRVRPEHLKLSTASYERKKAQEAEKMDAIKDFLLNKETCYQSIILSYFGEDNNFKCGKCIVCKSLNSQSFVEMQEKILELISSQKYLINELINQFEVDQKKTIGKIIHQLEDKQVIQISNSLEVIKGPNWKS